MRFIKLRLPTKDIGSTRMFITYILCGICFFCSETIRP